LDNVTFSSNSAGYYGGAIWNTDPNEIYAEDCHFQDNSATQGGAIQIDGGEYFECFECSFMRNTASCAGGAILLMDDSDFGNQFIDVSLVRTTIQDNTAGPYGYGGAIYSYSCSAGMSLFLEDDDISRNSASSGGAFWIDGATDASNNVTLVMSEVNQNTADYGGAFVVEEASVLLSLTRVSDNVASSQGAGFFVLYSNVTADCSDMFNDNAGLDGGIVECSGWSNVVLGDGSCPFAYSGKPSLADCQTACVVWIGGKNAC